MDDVVQAANESARSCIVLLHPSGTRLIYKPRTHINFGSPGKNESVEPAVVNASGGNEAVPNIKLWGSKGAAIASNTGDQSVVREGVVRRPDHVHHGANNSKNNARKNYTCEFSKGFLQKVAIDGDACEMLCV